MRHLSFSWIKRVHLTFCRRLREPSAFPLVQHLLSGCSRFCYYRPKQPFHSSQSRTLRPFKVHFLHEPPFHYENGVTVPCQSTADLPNDSRGWGPLRLVESIQCPSEIPMHLAHPSQYEYNFKQRAHPLECPKSSRPVFWGDEMNGDLLMRLQ